MTGAELKAFASRVADDAIVETKSSRRSYVVWEPIVLIRATVIFEDPKPETPE